MRKPSGPTVHDWKRFDEQVRSEALTPLETSEDKAVAAWFRLIGQGETPRYAARVVSRTYGFGYESLMKIAKRSAHWTVALDTAFPERKRS